MDDETFQIENYHELRATHKMMMEARFCTNPIDLEIPISAVAAGLHDRIMKKLMTIEIEHSGESAKKRWDEWLEITADYREWEISLENAKNDKRWLSWTDLEQRFFTMTLLSPFIVSESLIAEFVGQVQLHHLQIRDQSDAA